MGHTLDEQVAAILAAELTERFGEPITPLRRLQAEGVAMCEACGGMMEMDNSSCTNCDEMDEDLDESAPEGWEGTVKAMKKHPRIENPWALAHYMSDKGYKSHRTASGKKKR